MRQILTEGEKLNRMLHRVFGRAVRKAKSDSRYKRHQGKQECARRLRKMGPTSQNKEAQDG